MKVISILNQKGGVGKTTSTYNIGALLAQDGFKVLMIDSDSQASLTLALGLDPLSFERNLISIYKGISITDNCIYPTQVEGLDIIPSNLSLARVETELLNTMLGRELKIKKALKEVSGIYDYVLIDCPPSLNPLTINNLVASDYVIAPCETTSISIYALDDLVETIRSVKEINPNINFMGVIATKFVSVSKTHNAILNEMKENYKVLGIIKNSVSSQVGTVEGLPCVIADKNGIVAKGYRELVTNIEDILEGE